MDNRLRIILTSVIILFSALLIALMPNSSIFLAVKIILIIILTVAFYLYFGQPLPAFKNAPGEETEEEHEEESADKIPEIIKIDSDRDVEMIFNSFLDTLMPLAKTTLVADSVVLLLVNFPQKKFHIRYRVTDFDDQFTREKLIDLGQGLPSLILKNKTALIENHLPESEHLLPYYNNKKVSAKSFIGVPVYYNQHVMGVFCADSSAEESFSNEDLEILKSISKLVSIQLISSNKLFEYETENWIAKILYEFSRDILKFQSADKFWNYLIGFIKETFKTDRVIISQRISNVKAQVSYVDKKLSVPKKGDKFPLNEGIVGWVFRKNQSLLVDDFASKDNYIPRYYLNETPADEYRSLLAVPVNGNDMVRAVISMESYHGFHFKDQHKKILETMAYQIAALLEKIDVLEKFSEQNVFDSGTGLGNLKALQIELDKEVERSKEFQKKFTLLLVKLNIQSKHPGNEVVDKVVSEFITFALPHFPSSSNLYRISDNTIGIIMAEKILRDVLPKAKEICDKVSLKKVWGEGLVDNFSINCGLVQCPEMGVNSSELIEKAQRAILKAEQQGVNQSALYERSEGSSE